MTFEPCTIADRIRQTFPTLHRRFAGLTVLLVAMALPTAGGQTLGLGTSKNAAPAPQQAAPDPFGRSTPRGTIEGFIRAAQRNDFVAAARYMELTEKQRAKTEELTRDLRELMDRYYNDPLAAISDSPSGNLDDGLPFDQEGVPLKIQGERVDIILKRVTNPQTGLIWLISSDTLAEVPALAQAMEETWVERIMPQVLLDHTFLGVSLALWVAGLASIALPLLVFWSMSSLGIFLLRKTVDDSRRTRLTALAWPFTVVLTITVHLLLLPWLGLSLGFRMFYNRACSLLLVIAVAWLLHRIFRLSFERARSLMERRHQSDRESLILLGQRVFNVLLTLATIFAVLTILGIDTKTALAGVGIGGVAVALGAQKTVENLLGGIFLLTDKALAVGDTCCISSRLGTVEDITLRSVRLRTQEQTLVSIPAGALSQANIENFATRQKILAQTNLQLRYGTTTEQLRSVLDGIRKLLVENPKIETETARVRLMNFGARAIELELYAYVLTPDNAEFLRVREELFLHIAEVVEASGTTFAMPTEFIYAEQMADGRRGGLSAAEEIEQREKVSPERSKTMMKRAI
jgi:MscS family membrane protein